MAYIPKNPQEEEQNPYLATTQTQAPLTGSSTHTPTPSNGAPSQTPAPKPAKGGALTPGFVNFDRLLDANRNTAENMAKGIDENVGKEYQTIREQINQRYPGATQPPPPGPVTANYSIQDYQLQQGVEKVGDKLNSLKSPGGIKAALQGIYGSASDLDGALTGAAGRPLLNSMSEKYGGLDKLLETGRNLPPPSFNQTFNPAPNGPPMTEIIEGDGSVMTSREWDVMTPEERQAYQDRKLSPEQQRSVRDRAQEQTPVAPQVGRWGLPWEEVKDSLWSGPAKQITKELWEAMTPDERAIAVTGKDISGNPGKLNIGAITKRGFNSALGRAAQVGF